MTTATVIATVAAIIAQVCDQISEDLPFNSTKASLARKIITAQ
jgi:hypothetical protein